MRIKNEYILCRSSGNNIVFREEGGVRSVGVLSLNDVGALLWQMLAEGNDRAALERRLCRDFGITPERASGDVAAFLGSLADADVIEK